jgi:hypothetical protein
MPHHQQIVLKKQKLKGSERRHGGSRKRFRRFRAIVSGLLADGDGSKLEQKMFDNNFRR